MVCYIILVDGFVGRAQQTAGTMDKAGSAIRHVLILIVH